MRQQKADGGNGMREGTPAFFETDTMTVGYGGKALIRDICLRLRRGEILTLIGPNGAGKSTILKSVTRQIALVGGAVYLDGRDMRAMTGNQIARRLAVVLTERIRPEMMTCFDVVATGRYPYTGALGLLGAEDRRKTQQAMELVQVWDLRERPFSAVSDGQRQRLLLARAICQEPELIVLDEPTSFLDVRHKLEFLKILRDLVRERQVAVLMSLHELDLAQKISDRIVCVRGDTIAADGTPEEIFTQERIRDLYGITSGTFDVNFGCMELEAVTGTPEVFVISGNGSAIPVFRALARRQIPFAAGILHSNDIDCEAARSLAAQVIETPAFEVIGEDAYQRARQVMLRCREVRCPLNEFGPINEANRRLRDEAEAAQLLKRTGA